MVFHIMQEQIKNKHHQSKFLSKIERKHTFSIRLTCSRLQTTPVTHLFAVILHLFESTVVRYIFLNILQACHFVMKLSLC